MPRPRWSARRRWGSAWRRGAGGIAPGWPASFYNDQGPRISENYYLQIAQETGLIGLGIFMSINCLVLFKLYKSRNRTASRLLLASGLGVMVANVLMHAWADEVIAMLWWGLAAMEIAGTEQNVNLRL
jgi:O-antigen ligase